LRRPPNLRETHPFRNFGEFPDIVYIPYPTLSDVPDPVPPRAPRGEFTSPRVQYFSLLSLHSPKLEFCSPWFLPPIKPLPLPLSTLTTTLDLPIFVRQLFDTSLPSPRPIPHPPLSLLYWVTRMVRLKPSRLLAMTRSELFSQQFLVFRHGTPTHDFSRQTRGPPHMLSRALDVPPFFFFCFFVPLPSSLARSHIFPSVLL